MFGICCAMMVGGATAQTSGSNTNTMPLLPSGWLTANPTVVQTGTKPTISWGVNYPSVVEDYITITAPSTVTTKEVLDCEIRFLGSAVGNPNGDVTTYCPTEALLSYNGGRYSRIFYGTVRTANPNTVVWSKNNVPAGSTFRFGGRYYAYNGWSTMYTSGSRTTQVRSLVNNSVPPFKNMTGNFQTSLEAMIKPFITPNGRVKVGPMDLIVFMELTHTRTTDSGYDMQDMVLLVTFKSRASSANNGHGNNLDGIDSSNPGNAPFINLDTDPEVDDEAGTGGP